MEEWKEYKLGEIIKVLDFKRIPLSSQERSMRKGYFPYYGAQGIIDYVDDYIFDGTYLLIAEDGENLKSNKQNIAQIARGKFWVNNHAHIVDSNGLCDIRYLCYLLNNIDISGYITGSAQPKLNQANLLSIVVKLPFLNTQQSIANYIAIFDEKIELNRRINDNLEQQAQALFKAWFVDFEPFKDGKFVDSELGMIPEGWKVYELGNLCDSISMTHPCKKGELIFLNTGDIENGSVLTNKYMNIKDMPGQAKKSIKENDILYSEIRPINRHYAFVNFPAHEYIVSTKLMVIRAIDKKLAIRLYQYLTSDDVINELQHEAESRSGTFPQIRFENIKKIKILIGPNDIENQYTEFIENIYKMIFQYREEVIKLEHLRDTLLPKLMSGELKINNFNN